jgi:hypothetical protein
MKKLFKILAIVVLLIIALIIILPFVFKGKIIQIAKREINRNVEATVDFGDMDLSLIKNFPNFSLGIDELSLMGKGQFKQDTLLYVKHTNVVIDLFSVFGGERYEVKRILVDSPKVVVKVVEDGSANYDIAKTEETVNEESLPAEESGFSLSLKQFRIISGQIIYLDEQSGMKLQVKGFDNSLSGDFSTDQTKLKNKTYIQTITFSYGAIDYLSNATVSYSAVIDADLKNGIYTLGKNELKLNELSLGFSGSVSTVQEGLNLVLAFDASNNSFKNILSMVPAVYTQDFENMEADGTLSLDGNIKGIYSEEMMPSFNINIDVSNGRFSYPELPGTVTNITLDANISNPGGDADNTIIKVSQFGVKLGPNPFMATLLVKTPVSDPFVDAKIKGTLDLSTVRDYYPVKDELSGKFITDITLKGNLSAIDEERYEDFIALGSVLVQDLTYATATFNEPVKISSAQLNFAPEYLDLVSFTMNIGKSDLTANGKITNYLAYTFKNGELKGNLTTRSDYFNIDELVAEEAKATETVEEQEPSSEETEETESKILEVPDKIDFTLQSSFASLTYDNIGMKQLRGKVRIRNKVLTLENLRMHVVQGQMTVNGSYSTKSPETPEVNLDVKLNNLDIPAAYNAFAIMRNYLPIARKTTGSFSAGFSLSSKLDNKMMPVYETMNGAGNLSTSPIRINDLNTLVQLANVLNYTDLERVELNKLNAGFQFVDGKMAVNPFNIKYKNVTATIEGWTGFDQSIGYVMNMNIPREELGAGANQLMENLLNEANKLGGNFSLPETIAFDIVVGGTLSNPKIQTGLADSNDLIEQAREEVIREVSAEALKKAREILDEAERRSKDIMAEARRQANMLKQDADKVVSDLKKEYNRQADSLVALGKKNGFVAELAAKEAARQLKAEADVQAGKLLTEADTQADKLIGEAEKISKSIRDEAQRQADALLKQD